MSRGNAENSGHKPLRLFVDANTIVSGVLFEGNEATLLKLGAVGLCRLITTRDVLQEVARTLQATEFKLSDEEVAALMSYANRCLRVYESLKPEELNKHLSRLADKKDVHVLAAFEKLGCDILVTGDKELLRKVPTAKTTRQTLELLLGGK